MVAWLRLGAMASNAELALPPSGWMKARRRHPHQPLLTPPQLTPLPAITIYYTAYRFYSHYRALKVGRGGACPWMTTAAPECGLEGAGGDCSGQALLARRRAAHLLFS